MAPPTSASCACGRTASATKIAIGEPTSAPAPPPVVAPAAAAPRPPAGELDRLVADLCDVPIVLLGEASHGDAVTWQTKGVLLERLVDECGFDAVLFESGIYEFLSLEHALAAGQARPEQLADAIGAMWSQAEESEPWMAALFERAVAGRVALGGIDDQVSSTARYAQERMAGELAGHLRGDRRAACEASLARHLRWEYDERHAYAEPVRAVLVGCLAEIEATLSAAPPSPPVAEHAVMAASLRRSLARDFGLDRTEGFNARDRSMYEGLEWHRARLPADAKIVVWCATIHALEDASPIPTLEGLVPLGAHVHRAHGPRAASIGFTAQSGRTAALRQPEHELSLAPPESLEGRALAEGLDLRYLDRETLRALGELEARPVGHAFHRARWGAVLDGLVVFRRERPPRFPGTR